MKISEMYPIESLPPLKGMGSGKLVCASPVMPGADAKVKLPPIETTTEEDAS